MPTHSLVWVMVPTGGAKMPTRCQNATEPETLGSVKRNPPSNLHWPSPPPPPSPPPESPPLLPPGFSAVVTVLAFAMPIEVGDEFADFKSPKDTMADWSIAGKHKPTFRYQKSDKTRNIVLCAHANSSFRVYAAMNKEHDMVKVVTVDPNHFARELCCCPAVQRTKPGTAHFPCYPYSHEETTPSEIIDAAKLYYPV